MYFIHLLIDLQRPEKSSTPVHKRNVSELSGQSSPPARRTKSTCELRTEEDDGNRSNCSIGNTIEKSNENRDSSWYMLKCFYFLYLTAFAIVRSAPIILASITFSFKFFFDPPCCYQFMCAELRYDPPIATVCRRRHCDTRTCPRPCCRVAN